jgi:hypothetical protein
MKKVLIVALAIVLVLLGALLIIPIIYKDKIQQKLSEEINKDLNAKVFFNANDFSLSVFSNFPNITAKLSNFGVVGINEFEGDTLAHIERFELVADIMSVLKGEQIKIKAINLTKPKFNVIVLANGKANYDIVKPDTTKPDPNAKVEPTQFSIGIESWTITEGFISYVDQVTPMNALIVGLNHEGSGDFTQDIFDLNTQTTVQSLSYEFDSVSYISNKQLDANLVMEMDLKKSKFTFKDNLFKLNEFAFGFNGYVALPDTATIETDMTFEAKETNFKNLLSLVPGVFTKDFNDIKTDGTIAFKGFVKGKMQGENLPAYQVSMQVNNGSFQYPKLPSSVTGINIDMLVENKTPVMDNLAVNFKKLEMKIGKNPISGKLSVQGLTNMNIDGNLIAKLDLAEISKAFPMDGLTLNGLFGINATAKGVYNAAAHKMPAVAAKMDMIEGYVKSKDLPAPLEHITFNAEATNATGVLNDTKVKIPNFSMQLEGERIDASGSVENFDDYIYALKLKGAADLAKMTKIYPIEGMVLTGKVNADIATSGQLSDVTASRYDKLPTSGTMSLSNFSYVGTAYPQGVKIATANLAFDPAKMTLTNTVGSTGETDFNVTGNISNYLAYILNGKTIKGNLDLKSRLVNVNQMMGVQPTPAPNTTTAETPMTVIEVPKNIDFTFKSTIEKVLYDNLVMEQLTGGIIVKEGVVKLENLKFNMLGGGFTTNGTYDATNLNAPKADFKLGINNVAFSKAYEAFNTIKKLAPIAKNLNGNFSTDFNISTVLDSKMQPVFSTINGGGLVKVLNGSVQSLGLVSGINTLTKMNVPSSVSLKDLLLQASIENGKVNFKPFDIALGGQKLNIGGSQSFDGAIDYNIKMAVPAGAIGTAANTAIAGLLGKPANAVGQNINLNINVGGTMDKPQYKLLSAGSGSVKQEAKAAIKTEVTNQINNAKAEVEAKARAEAERVKAEAEARVKAEADRLKNEAKKKAEEELKKLKGKFKF